MRADKSHRGATAQFYVAGELCRNELVAVVTLGNCPNTDVLVSNKAGTHFAHVQVKTYRPGRDKTCSVGQKAERDYGPNFFWVIAGIPDFGSTASFEYFIIPSPILAPLIREMHELWKDTPGKRGQMHNDSMVRCVEIPPNLKWMRESIEAYRDRWDLIRKCCGCE